MMSELASIVKLCEWLHTYMYDPPVLMEIVNEIEREVSERFIELPVDADGVPIHLGDLLWVLNDYPFYVHSIVVEKDKAFVKIDTNREGIVAYKTDTYKTDECHHAKSRTVEDVLTDLEGLRGNGAMYEDVVMRAAKLAQELRELLGIEADDD
jgi:hypothetical protein